MNFQLTAVFIFKLYIDRTYDKLVIVINQTEHYNTRRGI